MPVAKTKKRLSVTLNREMLKTTRALLDAMGNKVTLSQLIEISLGFFAESAIKEIKKIQQNESKEASKNA